MFSSYRSTEQINMDICTGIPNEINGIIITSPSENTINKLIPNCQNVNLLYNNYFWLESEPSWLNITLNSNSHISPLSIPNNLLLSFNSYKFISRHKSSTFDFDSEIDFKQYTLYFGQTWFITFKPIITDELFRKGLELNTRIGQSSIGLEPNEIQIGIFSRINPRVVIYGEIDVVVIMDFITDIGGSSCKRSLKGAVARKYMSPTGIPLVERVDKRPEGSSLGKKAPNRRRFITRVLSFLERVRRARIKNEKFLRQYHEEIKWRHAVNSDIELDNLS
ncbi:hypothetical protein C1645_812737 [Glomus cerebriforme]|uniref:Uncharacterized protein n=1 Tax=Glomus cerebriforme TaxID=658196 RepID=A0A397TU82_9GLOM|nr:hypothetical protein C1645_812737 [Glomus cerebriforme]